MAEKRKWQCFVCGIEFKEYEQFKEHIIGAHEEGREYLKCPKCTAPCRDLKTHYKQKHPGWSFPKGVQDRCTIWKDPKTGRTKKPKFKSGTFESKKNNKFLHYRSGYELEVYELLEQTPEVRAYLVENLTIPYFFEGKWKNYIPDLTVYYTLGYKEIWEIKPSRQTSLPINEAKWNFASEYCMKRGLVFKVWTEKQIEDLKKHVRSIRRERNKDIME